MLSFLLVAAAEATAAAALEKKKNPHSSVTPQSHSEKNMHRPAETQCDCTREFLASMRHDRISGRGASFSRCSSSAPLSTLSRLPNNSKNLTYPHLF